MALVSCPECKKEIAESANSCPHCGFDIYADHMDDREATFRVLFVYPLIAYFSIIFGLAHFDYLEPYHWFFQLGNSWFNWASLPFGIVVLAWSAMGLPWVLVFGQMLLAAIVYWVHNALELGLPFLS